MLLLHRGVYEWRSTDWSECHITPLLSLQEKKAVNISALCGGGVQSRETYCVQVQDETTPRHGRDVSRPVSVSLCEEALIPSSVRSCSLPCSRPCLLSSWSSWGSCLPEDCNQGRRAPLLMHNLDVLEGFQSIRAAGCSDYFKDLDLWRSRLADFPRTVESGSVGARRPQALNTAR
ncbi:thrombospondin type-1 domain-containing protein 7B isoform X1 [Tachysurus ichikawai]